MLVLGINAYHGDVAAAILRDGELVAAVEEERFRRIKHYAGFPRDAIRACLAMAGAEARDIDAFAVSRDPKAHLWRKGVFALKHRPSLSLIRDRAANVMSVRHIAGACASAMGLEEAHVSSRMHYVEHHAAHLASSFFASPFDDAAVCAIDGFGDFVSTSTGIGRGPCIAIQNRVFFPHSLGLLYLALTQFLGFPKYGDEFKVMGLAPYGNLSYVDRLRQLVRVGEHGELCLDLSYFTHWSGGMTMTWDDGEPEIGRVFTPKLEALLGPARRPQDPLDARHEAIAASLQRVYEEAAFGILRVLHARVRNPRLCLAGGCAMNSVANGKIRSETPFTDLYIQPAAGDNGTALGAALHVWHQLGGTRRFQMRHGYWGPEFDDAAIAQAIDARQREIDGRQCTRSLIASEEHLCEWTATRIADGKVVGWFQGRMEWGARALGNRSIVADPRRRDMREIINVRIKFREKFRPFAPSVAVDALNDFFVDAVPDPFMLQVYPVRPDKRDVIPAVTHVDGSGRLQTVSLETNPRYWSLIQAFGRKTGVPVLLNTSFNENEPIVLTPDEALDCFLRTDMDVLVMGSHVLEKRAGGRGQGAEKLQALPATCHPPPATYMHVCFFNRSYWPDLGATGQLLTELAEDLVRVHGWDVTVVAGYPLRSNAKLPASEWRNGVHIVRAAGSTLEPKTFAGRATNYLTYFASAAFSGLRVRKPDVVVALTDPPIIGLAALAAAKKSGVPFVFLCEDIFPEVATLLEDFHSGTVNDALTQVNRFLVRKARRIIALGDTMKRRLVEGKGADPAKVAVIHNWADCTAVAPGPRDNPFARAHGLVDRFVALHAGNIGLSQDLEIVLHAAEQLRDRPDIAFVFVGDGAKKKDLQDLAQLRDLRNVMFLPYQPREAMDQSYATADVSLISLKRGLAGVIVPSKVYNVLASGRPCVAAVERGCEVADIIDRAGCGYVVAPGDASALRARVVELAANRERAEAMGARAREAALAFDRPRQVAAYDALLREVAC